MGLYKYTALEIDNTQKSGVMEGGDRTMVAKRLMQQGLRPIEIRDHAEGGWSFDFSLARFRKNKITKADIDFFTKQVSLLLEAGLSLDAALRIMREQTNKPAFKEFTGQLEQKLKEGKSFSEALADYPYFSSMYVSVVKAGEEGGILPEMLMKMSEYQASFQELRQYVISASIYPLFLLFVGLLAMMMLVLFILPRFEVLFEGMGQQLPMNVKFMMNTAKFIKEHVFIAFALLLTPPVAVVSYFRSPQGRITYDRLVIKVPVLSGFIRDLQTTRIFRTIEVLVENGVHLAIALKIGSGVATNMEYQRSLNRATEALKEGRQVGKKLREEGLLPDLAADLLSIGEESGRVGQVCGQIADHYEHELRARIKRIIALIEPLFILLIAVVAGYVVISMLTVILSINEIAG